MDKYALLFDLNPCTEIDQHALIACQAYNFGNERNWFGTFRGGLYGFQSRIVAVQKHYIEVHAWIPVRRIMGNAEYHLSAILFFMDSAVECFTFALNAIGNGIFPDQFRDVTAPRALAKVRPTDILGRPYARPAIAPLAGYTTYFPTVTSLWSKYQDLLQLIFDHHDVSKHRETIFRGGKSRNDPPPGFWSSIGVDEKDVAKGIFAPMEDIILIRDSKAPRYGRSPTLRDEQIPLENVAVDFCTFINDTLSAASQDIFLSIKPPIPMLRATNQVSELDTQKNENKDA